MLYCFVMRQLFIAEVKTRSPFGFESDKSWDELFEVAAQHGKWISVHTNPRWGGSMDLITRAKGLTDKPVLAKGIHKTDDEIKEALDAGADYVLTVRDRPSDTIDPAVVLYEPRWLQGVHDISDAIGDSALHLVWNARDLRTGGGKLVDFSAARNMTSAWMAQASMIETVADVHPEADAIIVGQHLEKFVASL